MPIDVPDRTTPQIPRIAALVLAGGIFVVDAFTTLGSAIAVLYAVVIILAATSLDRRGLMAVVAICVALTILGFLIGHGGTFPRDPTIRCVVSLSAIAFTAFLAVRNHEATTRLLRQAALLDLTHEAIFVRAADDTITYWNRGAEKLYGWTSEEAVGCKTAELLQTRFPMDVAQIQAELYETGRWEGGLSHVRRDGGQLIVASRWSLHRDPQGRPLATMETNSDITERHQVEEALQRTRAELSHVTRVSTLGELAASIAHEVNQPLAAVVTNGEAGLRWLNRDVPKIDEAKASLDKMISNGRRASDVIARLRALARRSDTEHLPVDVNEIVQDILMLVQREIVDRRVNIDLSLDRTSPVVSGDRVQLQQVVINLVINALQAMESTEDDSRNLLITTRLETSDTEASVVLEVTDSGPGIDAVKASELFAAFFTTKANGMGMGLSICRSIVEAHGGQIGAQPNTGAGATFTIRLPALQMETA